MKDKANRVSSDFRLPSVAIGLPKAMRSSDIVTASFVLHGVKEDRRRIILNEMKRVSKEYVVINDYYGHTPAFAAFLEYLEKSDHHHFKANFLNELDGQFSHVKRIDASMGTSVYFASKKAQFD